MSAHFLKNRSALSSTFVTEMLTHPGSFCDFYEFVEKKLSAETLDFCMVALYYKSCPAVHRKFMEPQIFECFVKNQSPKEINIPAKIRKEVRMNYSSFVSFLCLYLYSFTLFIWQVEQVLGLGKSEVFDDALVHCTESLCTNFWIGFAAQLRPDKTGKISKSSIKSIPKYLHTPVLSLFCKESAKYPYFNFEAIDSLRNVCIFGFCFEESFSVSVSVSDSVLVSVLVSVSV
jgi:hypothetical protein